MSTPPIQPTGQLPPSYPPAPAGYYYPQPVVVYQPTSGLAIFSGIAGIVSWLLCPRIGLSQR